MTTRPLRILPVIILSQFAGTGLWFAGNAVLGDLERQWGLAPDVLGYVTSAVQLGFIVGTLTFAFFAVSDLFSPRKVFFLCSLAGAVSNLAIYLLADGLPLLLAFRFATGFFLAGVYPVGMKIATGWYQRGLGNAIGLLVGALVLGTAFPHLLRGLGQQLPWEAVTVSVSGIAALGGLAMLLLVPDGPIWRKGRISIRRRSRSSSVRGLFVPRPLATSATCGSSTPSGRSSRPCSLRTPRTPRRAAPTR